MSGLNMQLPVDGRGLVTLPPMPLCTITAIVFFGSIVFATVAMATKSWLHGDILRALRAAHMASNSACEKFSHPIRDNTKANRNTKRHIPELELSFTSIFVLFYHLSQIGCIIFVVSMLEYYPIFAETHQLNCDIDLFIFLILICVLVGLFSIKPNTNILEYPETLSEKQMEHGDTRTSSKKSYHDIVSTNQHKDNVNGNRQNGLSIPTRRRVSASDSTSQFDELGSILSSIDGYSLDRNSDKKKRPQEAMGDDDKDLLSTTSSSVDADTILEDILLHEEKTDSEKAPEPLELGELSDLPIFALNPDVDVLNIHQNLELKGFMTICFLFYHYTNANSYEILEVAATEDEMVQSETSINDVNESTNYYYNMSRIFVTMFLFLTGFGHTMYCYRKNDYSLNRFVHVLFRINLSGMFLCMALGKPYIFYKACWLHSYFFIIIFLAMKWKKDINYTKYGLRLKLTLLAVVIFVLWDCNFGLWSIHVVLFGTSKQQIDGAPYGQLWEFYFRAFMHHWVPFIGMLFALNHPVTSLLIRRLEMIGSSSEIYFKAITGILLSGITIVWALGPFGSSKFIYNAINPYFGTLPVLCYIYFRNISPAVRSYHVEAFKKVGVYSLEIYLLHIHLFVGEDKTTKTLLPGYPTCNLLCIIWLTVMIAKYLRTATAVVTSMISCPGKGSRRCKKHLLVMFGTLAIIQSFATIFDFMHLIRLEIVVTSTILCGILLYQAVIDSVWNETKLKTASFSENSAMNNLQKSNKKTSTVSKSSPTIVGAMILLIFCLVWQILSENANHSMKSLAITCIDNVNAGRWVPIDSCTEFQKGRNMREFHSQSANTICVENFQWGWSNAGVTSKCKFHFHSNLEAQKKMIKKTIVFLGDSSTRNLFFSVCRTFGDSSAGVAERDLPLHSDITKKFGSVKLEFKWAPLASDVLGKMNFSTGSVDIIVVGIGVMDKLHIYATDEDKQSHTQSLERLAKGLQLLKTNNIPTVWFTPVTVNTRALPSEEKRTHMSESSVEDIRNLYKKSGVNDAAMFVLEGHTFTKDQVHLSYDGIHYPPLIYDVGAQIMMNALDWIFPNIQMSNRYIIDNSFEPKTGVMANKYLGLMILSLVVIGLFFHDAYFGLFYVSSMIIRPNAGLSKWHPVSIYSFSPLSVFTSVHQFMQKQMKIINESKLKQSLDGRNASNQADDINSILSSSSHNRRGYLGNLDTISEDLP